MFSEPDGCRCYDETTARCPIHTIMAHHYDEGQNLITTPAPPKIDTKSLLGQQQAHEKKKSDHIAALLKEREDIKAAHAKRLTEIEIDISALGYKKPRAPRTPKGEK